MLPIKLAPEKEVPVESIEEAQDFLESDFRVEYFQTSVEEIEIHEDGTVTSAGKCWHYTPTFLESLAKMIKMPLNYAHRIDFDLFKTNFDRRKQQDCCGVKFCISRNTAINVCKADYYPARTADVIKGLPAKTKQWRLHGIHLGDRGIEISWCDETVVVKPRPGDTILGGVRLSNSETGFRGLKVSLFTLRLACSNGAIISDEQRVVRWSYDRRMTYTTNVEKFCKELELLEIPQTELAERYSRILDKPISDREVVNLWRRIRRIMAPQRVDDILGIQSQERIGLFERVREHKDPFVSEDTNLNAYNIYNRVTAAAKDFSLILRRRLEEIGGDLLWRVALN